MKLEIEHDERPARFKEFPVVITGSLPEPSPIVLIDEQQRWDGACPFCELPRTVFAVRLESGAWTRSCKACAGDAAVMI
jgi:hypothetical protein